MSCTSATVSASWPLVYAQGFQGDVLSLIVHSGPVAKLVLLVLGMFSVMSWAIMAERHRALSRAEKEDLLFLEKLRSPAGLADLRDWCERLPFSTMAHAYRAGFKEIARSVRQDEPRGGAGLGVATETRAASAARIAERAMIAASSEAQARLEKHLSFLASVGSVSPYVGLFGTVWGIMNAFRSIGLIGTANLATVAPGISEALITTAAGLAAAIPAVLGYNHFNNRLRVAGNRMEYFIADVLNRFEKGS